MQGKKKWKQTKSLQKNDKKLTVYMLSDIFLLYYTYLSLL